LPCLFEYGEGFLNATTNLITLFLWYFRKASSPFRPWLLHFKTRIVVCCHQKFRKPYFWITVNLNLLNTNLAKTIFLLTPRFSYLAL